MKIINLYRIEFLNGNSSYKFFLQGSIPESDASCSIKSLAKNVRDKVDACYSDIGTKMGAYVFIKMEPEFDIECCYGKSPKLCFSLTENEQIEFWNEFNKP